MSVVPYNVNLRDTTFDKVWAYYLDPEKNKLTKKQNEKRLRWLALYNLRINFHSRHQAVKAFIDAEKAKGNTISEAQVFRDMAIALKLFGDLHQMERKAQLLILQEYAYKTLQMAIKQKNPLAAVAALNKLDKYMEIDKTDDINFNPEKLVDKQDKYYIPKSTAVLLEKILGGTGVLDLNNVESEDIEFEEVNSQG